jgi:hypothetical protein
LNYIQNKPFTINNLSNTLSENNLVSSSSFGAKDEIIEMDRMRRLIADQYHYTPRIRYTEIFLAYAEAANQAYGPQDKGGNGYSAYDVVKKLRHRAGIGRDNGDAYLESIKNDQAKMAELIRNERRIELCFEGFRFWDLRRWKSNLTETAKGMNISGTRYTPMEVDKRSFSEYMYYGPIPYSEVLKYDELKQNQGW